jgi:hypothetical protein
MRANEIITEKWSAKYKRSINCSHPRGFSQRAHCAGKNKHTESIEMEQVCPDCGMCQTHGNVMEIRKGQKDANGYTRCWPGKHAEGTKTGKNGGPVRNCVPNESQGVAEDIGETPQQQKVRAAISSGLAKSSQMGKAEYQSQPTNRTYFDNAGYASDKLTGIDSIDPDGTVVISIGDTKATDWVKKLAALGGMPGVKTREVQPKLAQGVAEGTKLVADGSVINAYYNGIHIGNIFASNTKDTPYKAYSKHWDMSRLFKSKKAAAEWLAQTHQTAIKEEVHNPGMTEDLTEEFDLIESIIEGIAAHNGVDAEAVWEDLESLTEDELYAFAVTSQLNEDWQKANKQDRTAGMSQKAVNAYRREHPGSKLKTAVTTKPSKLKKGSKASKRRKSYCSRSRGQMKMHNISCAKTPDKAICKARRRWNC